MNTESSSTTATQPGGIRRKRGDSRRSRVLLYLCALGIDELTSLELAAECLRRCGPDCAMAAVMDAVHAVVAEKTAVPAMTGRLRSFPPLKRTTMISRPMERFTLYGSAKRLVMGVLGAGKNREANPKNERRA